MVNGKLLSASKLLIFICFVTTSLLRCSYKKNHTNDKFIDEFEHLSNGDIIYRLGDGIFSEHFKNTSSIEKLYSHTGVIYIDGDEYYVIHSEASEFTGIGGVRKDKLNIFLDNINTWAVYRIDTTQTIIDTIVYLGIKYAKQNTPFDLNFDNDTDTELYCSELVATIINKVYKRSVIKASGIMRGKPYFSIDDTYLIDEMTPIVKYINGQRVND